MLLTQFMDWIFDRTPHMFECKSLKGTIELFTIWDFFVPLRTLLLFLVLFLLIVVDFPSLWERIL